tara:strand:- start:238 stop:525 length:288 start_codon:yes stop_codon:yes gene_type:complete
MIWKWLDKLLDKIYYLPKEWKPTEISQEQKDDVRLPNEVDEMYAKLDKYVEEANIEDEKDKPKTRRKSRTTKKTPVKRTITKRRKKKDEGGSHGE